jgi:hypothetical protein
LFTLHVKTKLLVAHRLKAAHLDQFIIVIASYRIEVDTLGSWPNNRKYNENDTREILTGTPNWLIFLIQKCIDNFFITIIWQ